MLQVAGLDVGQMGAGRLFGQIRIFFRERKCSSGQNRIFRPFSKVSGPRRCPKRSGTSFSSILHPSMPQNLFPGPILTPKCQICKISNFPSLLSPPSSDPSPLPTPVLKTPFILPHSIPPIPPNTQKKSFHLRFLVSFSASHFFDL